MLAAEWMEAGRSIMRGLVTPDRTTVIASTHRAFAVQEKGASRQRHRGFGRRDRSRRGRGEARSSPSTCRSMAERNGTVISATLFGDPGRHGPAAVCRREAFEAAIRAGGKGAEPSLKGFSAAAFDRALAGKPAGRDAFRSLPPPRVAAGAPSRTGHAELDAVAGRVSAREVPMRGPGASHAPVIERLVDYQDAAYGAEYLERPAAPMLALLTANMAARLPRRTPLRRRLRNTSRSR